MSAHPTTDATCADCAEFFYTCRQWPASQPFACGDFFRLPDVGVGGAIGQKVPPSRMGGRTEPRVREDAAETPDVKPVRARRQADSSGPRAIYSEDGVRRCGCGQAIPARKRCCNACREVRRQATIQGRRKAGSQVPVADTTDTPA